MAVLRAWGKLYAEKILWIYASNLWLVEIAAYNFFPIISLPVFMLPKWWVWASSSSSTSRSVVLRHLPLSQCPIFKNVPITGEQTSWGREFFSIFLLTPCPLNRQCKKKLLEANGAKSPFYRWRMLRPRRASWLVDHFDIIGLWAQNSLHIPHYLDHK